MGKSVIKQNELFRKLIDPCHLLNSARAAAKGKRRKPDVAKFLLNQEEECLILADQLALGKWRPGPYRTFTIVEPKTRLISAAPFRDRVVHHALVSLLEPIFERRFIHHSYACRVGKGTHRALMRAHRLAKKHTWVLKGDVVKYFPSIDHQVAKDAVGRVVRDKALLRVLDLVVDGSNRQERVSPYFYEGDDLLSLSNRRIGLPIGNLTSQFLANVVMDELDHYVTDGLGFGTYQRYCDDFLLFANDKKALWNAREKIRVFLEGLRLRLHDRKGGVIKTNSPVPFLGFILHGDRRRIGQQAVRRVQRRLSLLSERVEAGTLPLSDFSQSLQSWIAHANHGQTIGVRKAILSKINLSLNSDNF